MSKTDHRVAVMLAEGFEEIEALMVVDVLFRAGITCDTVAIEPDHTVTSSHGVSVVATRSMSDADFDVADYTTIVLPGGLPGAYNLRDCEALKAGVLAAHERGAYLAAICAAPSVYGTWGLLTGVNATSNPGFHEAIEQAGAILHADKPVVIDGHFITSQGAGTALAFGLALVRLLADDATAQKIADAMVVRSWESDH